MENLWDEIWSQVQDQEPDWVSNLCGAHCGEKAAQSGEHAARQASEWLILVFQFLILIFPKGIFWRSVRSKAEKLGSTLERALADSEHVQRNRLVLNISPKSAGFKEILPGARNLKTFYQVPKTTATSPNHNWGNFSLPWSSCVASLEQAQNI